MRQNLPVTDREVVLQDDDLIVSHTDDKGRITWVNPTFVRISGFEPDELLGKAHNIVRHPDMPPEAFADLWRTLQAGHPWTGLVKNRCKNGDFYWVRANVTPVLHNGRLKGYLSVRARASRAEIDATAAVYAQMRASERHGWVIVDGQAVRRGPALWFKRAQQLPIRTRMGAFAAGAIASFAAAAAGTVPGSPLPMAATWAALALGVLWTAIGWTWIDRTWLACFGRTQAAAECVAAGKLDVAFPTSADPGMQALLQGIQQMTMNTRAVIGDIRERVEQLNDCSSRLAEGSDDLAARTDAQASAQQESAASVEELTSAIAQSATSAGRVAELARTASAQADEGGQTVRRAVDAMGQIANASDKIGSFVGVINEVAFQTNILALNAAVEAARAGEAGRGFAVVAAEVRILAQRCATAAKEIGEQVADTLRRVDEGKVAADEAGESMRGIVQSVSQVSTHVSDIARGSEEQSMGLDQINQSLAAMEAVVERNAHLVNHMAELSKDLDRNARVLTSTVAAFEG